MCNTPYIVYLLQCKRCGKQYVGQTQKSLKVRYAKHLQNMRQTRHSTGILPDYFGKGECGNTNNIAIQLLHRVTPRGHKTPTQIEETLKQIETLWINRLMTVYPQGLNWLIHDTNTRT